MCRALAALARLLFAFAACQWTPMPSRPSRPAEPLPAANDKVYSGDYDGAETAYRKLGNERIEAEVFDVTDPDLVLLLQSAGRRGVRARIPAQDVNRPTVALLARSGGEVRWYRPPPGAKLHARAALADGLLVLGSENWRRHGLDAATADPVAVAAYEARFETDWEAAA